MHANTQHAAQPALRLTAQDLTKIADVLGQVAQSGIEITEFYVGDFVVGVERVDSQRDGAYYVVTYIAQRTLPTPKTSTCRGSGLPA